MQLLVPFLFLSVVCSHTHTAGVPVLLCWVPHVQLSVGDGPQTLVQPGPHGSLHRTHRLLLPRGLLRLPLPPGEGGGLGVGGWMCVCAIIVRMDEST